MRGAFIVFEGIDRTGKTTQASKLTEYMNTLNLKCQLLSFPDRSTSIGDLLNDYLCGSKELEKEVAHLLFSANRWELQPRISDLLKSGTNVLCDRYSFSGIVYSMCAQRLPEKFCYCPENGLIEPDITIYLKADALLVAERPGYGTEKFENLEIQKRASDLFDLISKRNSNWIEIDASQPIERIHETIIDQLQTRDVFRLLEKSVNIINHLIS